MNTKKILLVSSDRDITGIIKTSALTLTKLNCQVSITETAVAETAVRESGSVNLDLIIIDLDGTGYDSLRLIKDIRSGKNSGSKKIFSIHSKTVNPDEVFAAGCDSIMRKDEFKKVVNNILQF